MTATIDAGTTIMIVFVELFSPSFFSNLSFGVVACVLAVVFAPDVFVGTVVGAVASSVVAVVASNVVSVFGVFVGAGGGVDEAFVTSGIFIVVIGFAGTQLLWIKRVIDFPSIFSYSYSYSFS